MIGSISSEPKRLGSLDALRGWAIAGVISIHSSELIRHKGVVLARVLGHGRMGVQLFFVVSAIALCNSLHLRWKGEHRPIRNFFVRRFFRIAPLFYLAIIVSLLFDGLSVRESAPNGVHWWFVPMTILFVHGWHPEAINSIVPGGWSIAAEVTFYLCLPFLFLTVRNLSRAIIFFAAAALGAFLWKLAMYKLLGGMYPGDQFPILEIFVYFHFFGQLPVFAAGLVGYQWLVTHPSSISKLLPWFGAAALPALVVGESLAGVELNRIVSTLVITLFAVSLVRLESLGKSFLLHPAIIMLGKISFDLYLCHFYVLRGVLGVRDRVEAGFPAIRASWPWQVGLFLLVFLLSSGMAAALHHFLEKPGILLGKRLISRLESPMNQGS